ncbi:MAG TPA: hypothetical protein VFW81_07695 [Thermoanaerobaculia bacterium]|nr:hypothetical protein [Thermoanaerobaculia bacterium]
MSRDERATLLERDREWAAVASEGKDLERILSFWTDDAKVFPSGAPIEVGFGAGLASVARVWGESSV